MNQSEISQFFSVKKKCNDSIRVDNQSVNPVAAFYERCLKVSLPCNKAPCLDMKASLMRQISELKEKNTKAEDAVKICSAVIKKKDEVIEKLSKTLNGVTLDSKSLALPTENHPKEIESKYTFNDQFGKILSSEQLGRLRSIGTMPKDDSTFVFTCVNFLYEDRSHELQSKSLTGKGKNKEKMTPEKVKLLGQLYEERLNNLAIDEIAQRDRQKKLNVLIKNAIRNINKMNEGKEAEQKISDNLLLM